MMGPRQPDGKRRRVRGHRGELSVTDGRFETVARVGEIREGVGFACQVEGRAVAVFLKNGRYHAFDDRCPHQDFPLSDGSVDNCAVTCLYHGWRIGLEDGRWEENPGVGVATHPVRVVGDEVQVGVGD